MTCGLLLLYLVFVAWSSTNSSQAAIQERAAQSADTSAGVEEARRLNTESEKLFDAGRYKEAVPLAERALVLREKALGVDHPEVASTLNLLGKLYKKRADFARAEQALQRAARCLADVVEVGGEAAEH